MYRAGVVLNTFNAINTFYNIDFANIVLNFPIKQTFFQKKCIDDIYFFTARHLRHATLMVKA